MLSNPSGSVWVALVPASDEVSVLARVPFDGELEGAMVERKVSHYLWVWR